MTDSLPVFSSSEGEAAFRQDYQAVLEHLIASGPEEATPLVLLHAYFASAAVWYPNAGALSQNNRVYAVDSLGEANLSRPARPSTGLEEVAQVFSELFAALHIQQAVLVGNPFGGFCAASLAMLMPQFVRALVLISPAATFHGILPFYLHVFMPKAVNIFIPRLPGQERRVRRGVDWAHAALPPDALWDRLFYQALLHGTGTNRLFPRTYNSEDFQKLGSMPALLLVGDHERIYRSQDVIRRAKELLPGIETEIVPDAHHVAALANREMANRQILGFLERRLGS